MLSNMRIWRHFLLARFSTAARTKGLISGALDSPTLYETNKKNYKILVYVWVVWPDNTYMSYPILYYISLIQFSI